MMHYRRSDHDVTDAVDLTKPDQVFEAVHDALWLYCPEYEFAPLQQAFIDLSRMYAGQWDDYQACDVPYHDLQHVMDVTLATARLMAGYEGRQGKSERLGPERIVLGIVLALFHDCGYIRTRNDPTPNGAYYTRNHVARGADFLADYLPSLGLARLVPLATRLIHYTGYEIPLDQIMIDNYKDRMLGSLLGSADLIAQMADRCYLEKCRDRLYPEFVLGDMTKVRHEDGREEIMYDSAEELLEKTPGFYRHMVRSRLDEKFEHVADSVCHFFGGYNLYQEEIDRNIGYLDQVLSERNFEMLRRNLPDTPESRAFSSHSN